MFEAIKKKIHMRRIKKDALKPRVQKATMEQVQNKLRDYDPNRLPSEEERGIVVRVIHHS